MSNQRLMKVKEKAGDGYAKTNAIGVGGGPDKGKAERSERADAWAVRTGVKL